MVFYNPQLSNGTHTDVILTNISVGYDNDAFVGAALFPPVPVAKQADKYRIFPREGWYPEDDVRAPGTEANELPGTPFSEDTYYANEHALQAAIADEERENADAPFAPDRDATEMVTEKILIGRELAMKNMVTTVANYASGMSVTLSGTSQLSDYTNSDPFTVFRTAVRAIHASIFKLPTLCVMPWQVMSVLEDHPDLIDRIKYSERAVLTPELVATLLGLPRVIVPGVGVQTGAGSSVGYLWGKDIVFAYVPPRPGMRIPAFAYEFVWGIGGRPMVVDRWREEKRVSDVVRTRRRYDLKMVAVDGSGDSIAGYLIKNAIA